ncbi:hypothetical protein ACFU53_44920 [Streptomyces sp. NPDC057474]|uniref:IS1634 family transposase n=1 Tax=Streptomyces sp. NPDC057474 TaxID=3346144 RepID=UPI0036787D22
MSALALDMTNFATYIDTANGKAPIAQRGKAKQKRADLRLVGLGLVVTRDGGVPLLSHAYPGNRPDATQFTTMIDELCTRHAELAAGDTVPGEITVVFDAGQNSVADFAHLDESHLHFVGSIPPSDCTDLLKRPASARRLVDEPRFGGLTALETRRTVYGRDHRVVLTHSPALHTAQHRGFDQTLAKAEARLGDLAATLARGRTRRAPEQVRAEVSAITKDPWDPRHHHRPDRQHPQGPPPGLAHRRQGPPSPGERDLRQACPGHRPRPLDDRRHRGRLPLPVGRGILLPAAQGPSRRLLRAHAPLDRPQHPHPRLHLRTRPDRRPLDATPGSRRG